MGKQCLIFQCYDLQLSLFISNSSAEITENDGKREAHETLIQGKTLRVWHKVNLTLQSTKVIDIRCLIIPASH